MVNEERVRAVWQHLKLNPEEWDQDTWFEGCFEHHSGSKCGTVGCFGGWTNKLFGGEGADIQDSDLAQRLLGLTEDQADRLFFQYPSQTQKYYIGDWDWEERPIEARLEAMKKHITEITGVTLD